MVRTKSKARRDAGTGRDEHADKKDKRKLDQSKGDMGPPAKRRDVKPATAQDKEDGEEERGVALLAKLAKNRVIGRGEVLDDGVGSKGDATGTIPPKDAASTPAPSPTWLSTSLHDELSHTYALTTMSIISSASIQKKATRALEVMNTYPVSQTEAERKAGAKARESIVVLHAKAKVAGKLISVVEIVKREVGTKGGKWFQYNAVGSVEEEEKKVVTKKSDPKAKSKSGSKTGGAVEEDDEMDGVEGGQAGEGSEEEESFEVMKTPFARAIEGKPKIRAIPTMTVYLSRVRVETLRKAYGEQTNGLEKKP